MNDQQIDVQIRAALVARAMGSPAPDLRDRIHAAAATTRQERPLIALPGLGRLAPVRHLAVAATIGAAVLVVAGSLLLGTGGLPPTPVGPSPVPSSAPSPEPSGSPTSGPSEAPSGGPSAAPSPTAEPSQAPSAPPSADPGSVIRPDTVARVEAGGAGRVLDLWALPTIASDKVGEATHGAVVYIVDGPVDVDGVDWYQVKFVDALPTSTTLGWMADMDDGAATLAPATLECPGTDVADVRLSEIGRVAALYCYGGEEITVSGRVFCMPTGDLPENLQHVVTGPFWLDDGRYCAFQDDSGEPFFEIFGFPTDELPADWRSVDLRVSGHFDDPESSACRGLERLPSLTEAEAVFECRLGFHATGVAVAD